MHVFEAKPNGMYATRRQFSAEQIIEFALDLAQQRLARHDALHSPEATRRYLALSLAHETREVFGALFLDTQLRVIRNEVMFLGSIDCCTVHPRIVAQKALAYSANGIVVYHNHPSGLPEPSVADRQITTQLKDALNVLEIRLVDHFVFGGAKSVSFAERGWM